MRAVKNELRYTLRSFTMFIPRAKGWLAPNPPLREDPLSNHEVKRLVYLLKGGRATGVLGAPSRAVQGGWREHDAVVA